MTDNLTPEELVLLENSIGAQLEGELWSVYELQARRLIGMARRLLEIESALEFLCVSDRRVCLVVDYRAPGEATYQTRGWATIDVAKKLGWKGLTP